MTARDFPRAVSKGASDMMMIFYSPEGTDRYEWRSIVFSYRPIPVIYRLSSWNFTVVGVLILTFANAMSQCDSGFWWQTCGVSLCLQGVLSYMADVHTWGRTDLISMMWKWLDVLSAVALTSFTGPVLCYRMLLGNFILDADLKFAWIVAVIFALGSKLMGGREARKKEKTNLERLLLWHCGWHCMPLAGTFLIIMVVLRAQDEIEMGGKIADL